MLKITRLILLTLSVFLLLTDSQAQNNTYSPYSRFGIGDIAREGFGRNQALGGIGLGLRDPNHLNYLNPASNSAQDTMSFIFSTGVAGNAMQLKSDEGSHNVNNATLSHLAIGFPLSPWWKSSFGLVPYSQMGYKIIDVDLGQGTEYYWEGSGGINQFFFGNAFNLTENISAGINISYLFGSLNQSRELSFEDENVFSVNSKSRNTVGDFHIRYGLQYTNRIMEDYNYTVGIIYENKTALNTERELLTINELNTEAGLIRDTVPGELMTTTHIDLPSNYGIGASFRKDNKFLIGADYSFRQWSETNFPDQQNTSLVNSSSFNIGAQYIPDPEDFRSYLKTIHYRVGFHHSNTYLQLGGHQLKDYGITFGLGLPFSNTRSTFNLAIDLGRRGTTDLNLIQEDYLMFNFSLSLYDFWFFQRRIE